MESVNAWAAALCTAAVVCTALQILAPKNGLGKIFKLITAAFFLICMLTPLTKLSTLSIPQMPGTSGTQNAGEKLKDTAMEQLRVQSEAAILSLARKSLGDKDIFVQKVAVDMDMDEAGGIYINGVTLCLDKQDITKAAYARQVMERELGIEVNIVTE